MRPNGIRNPEFSWVQFVVWPIVVLAALVIFRDSIAKYIGDATDTKIKLGKDGIVIDAKRQLQENPTDNDRKKDEVSKQTPTPVATSVQPSPTLAQPRATPVVMPTKVTSAPKPTWTPPELIQSLPVPEGFRRMLGITIGTIVECYRSTVSWTVAEATEWARYTRLLLARPLYTLLGYIFLCDGAFKFLFLLIPLTLIADRTPYYRKEYYTTATVVTARVVGGAALVFSAQLLPGALAFILALLVFILELAIGPYAASPTFGKIALLGRIVVLLPCIVLTVLAWIVP